MGGLFLVGLGTGVFDVGDEPRGRRGRALPRPRRSCRTSTPRSAAARSSARSSAPACLCLHVPVAVHLVGVVVLLLPRGPVVPARLPAPDQVETDETGARGARGRPSSALGLARAAHAAHRRRRPRGRLHRGHGQRLGRGRARRAATACRRWVGVLGFAVFLTAMTAGRLLGTRVLDRRGRVPVLRVTVRRSPSSAACSSSSADRRPAFVGAAIWGVGASLGFPVGMSAAADDPARAAARMSRGRDDRLHRVPRRAAAARLPRRPLRRAARAARRRRHGVVALLAIPAVREPEGRHSALAE